MYAIALIIALFLLTSCGYKHTDCSFKPGVDVEATSPEKITKEGVKDNVKVSPNANVTCNF